MGVAVVEQQLLRYQVDKPANLWCNKCQASVGVLPIWRGIIARIG